MTKRNPKPECLLFDLGGVLVEWDGIEPLVALTGGRLTPEQARRFWLESDWVRRFEMGRCNSSEFATGAVRELGVDLSPPAFLEAFRSWDKGPLPGSFELLDALRPHFTLACLSNNNPLHWGESRLQELVARFHRSYASFEIGLMKPDPAAYEWVIADLELEPSAVLFFDDNPECVNAAQAAGMRSCLAKGPAMVRQALGELGIEVG
ncbi:MAG: HAD family phosphatase [Acidobacteria bacterium]|nr:MAG: HAD family phosphatase [Acidobacteriota bacterium]